MSFFLHAWKCSFIPIYILKVFTEGFVHIYSIHLMLYNILFLKTKESKVVVFSVFWRYFKPDIIQCSDLSSGNICNLVHI